MKQKPLPQTFPPLDDKQWSIIPVRNQHMLVNNYSIDEFIYEKIITNSWQLLKLYQARIKYTVSSTPQIILADQHQDSHLIELFVQFAPYRLDKIVNKSTCEIQVYLLLKNVIRTVSYLIKKHGFFHITYEMLRITRNCDLLIWYHQNYHSVYRQYPFDSNNPSQDTLTVINQIMAIFESAGCKRQLLNMKQKMKTQKFITFQKFKIMVEKHLKNLTKQRENPQKYNNIPEFLKTRNFPTTTTTVSPTNVHSSTTINFPKPITKSQNGMNPMVKLSSIKSLHQKQSSDHPNCYNQKKEDTYIQLDDQNKNNLSDIFKSNPQFSSNFVSENGSQNSEHKCVKICVKQALFSEQQENIKKQPNNKTPTNLLVTTGLFDSIGGSGRVKLQTYDDDDHNVETASLSEKQNKILVSSAGSKQIKRIKKLQNNFIPKYCKIIEENIEDHHLHQGYFKNGQDGIRDVHTIRQSEIQRDFNGLLESRHQSHCKSNSCLVELEKQIDNILLG